MTPGRCCFQDVRAIRTLTHVETFLESVDISVAPHDHGKRHSRRGSKRDTAVLDPGGLLGERLSSTSWRFGGSAIELNTSFRTPCP